MLRAIGVASIEQLFADVPPEVRIRAPLDLPLGKPEQEVYERMRALADRNVSCEDEISFLGGGMYDHYVPAIVDTLTQRAEFLTPYTPYQPEVSQGTLQVMFEYQTAISELTGLPVSNATLYEGPSALGAAAFLARQHHSRRRFLISRGVHPHSRETLATMSEGWRMRVDEVALRDGVTDADAFADALSDDVSAVFLPLTNFLGAVEDLAPLLDLAQAAGAVAVVTCDPVTLGVLEPPGALGADIAVGEGQALGNRLDFGGPSFGFFSASERFLRRMPGRIAGETRDVDGRRAFVLTLQTREQHIRREKATSNITTAQTLNAVAAVVYLSWLGRRGIVELGELLLQRTDYARTRLAAIDGVQLLHEQPAVREFAIRLPVTGVDAVRRVIDTCCAHGVNPGHPLGREYPEFDDGLLVALTERRSRHEIDRLADVLGAALATPHVEGNGRPPAGAGKELAR